MGRRYAIAVSFDTERLAMHQLTEAEAQVAVTSVLAERGFSALLPGLYAASGDVDAVGAVLAAQVVAETLPWFALCLRAARLLRIEEDGDLTVAF